MTDGRNCGGSASVVQKAKNHLLGLPPNQGVIVHDLEALHQGHGEEEQRYSDPALAGLQVLLVVLVEEVALVVDVGLLVLFEELGVVVDEVGVVDDAWERRQCEVLDAG